MKCVGYIRIETDDDNVMSYSTCNSEGGEIFESRLFSDIIEEAGRMGKVGERVRVLMYLEQKRVSDTGG